MIKLEIIQGQVEIRDLKTMFSEQARNNMVLDTSNEFHYMFKSYEDSYATILVDNRSFHLNPNSQVTLTNNKERFKVKHKHPAVLIVGKIWAWMRGPTNYQPDAGNAVIGVRG